MENKEIYLRFSNPTRYDKGEFGDICKVKNDKDSESKYFIQISKTNNYIWIDLGEFLLKAFFDKINNINFIEDCINRFIKNLDI